MAQHNHTIKKTEIFIYRSQNTYTRLLTEFLLSKEMVTLQSFSFQIFL